MKEEASPAAPLPPKLIHLLLLLDPFIKSGSSGIQEKRFVLTTGQRRSVQQQNSLKVLIKKVTYELFKLQTVVKRSGKSK